MPDQDPLLSSDADITGIALRNISAPPRKIGFIGLGLMGSAMAHNLATARYAVNAYVRRPEQVEELDARGVKATLHMQDLFDCDIVISMLPDDNAVRDVFLGNGN